MRTFAIFTAGLAYFASTACAAPSKAASAGSAAPSNPSYGGTSSGNAVGAQSSATPTNPSYGTSSAGSTAAAVSSNLPYSRGSSGLSWGTASTGWMSQNGTHHHPTSGGSTRHATSTPITHPHHASTAAAVSTNSQPALTTAAGPTATGTGQAAGGVAINLAGLLLAGGMAVLAM